MTGAWRHLLPPEQRRPSAELADRLDLAGHGGAAKRSAFWTMLVISAVIASAGVLADSTATVIGAMIIAPLSTPIMGMALGIVTVRRRLLVSSARFVALGIVAVTGVGVLASLLLPSGVDLLGNAQVAGRTSPPIASLLAALHGQVPAGVKVVVTATYGKQTDEGTVR
jgi:uncharacterized membrane protein